MIPDLSSLASRLRLGSPAIRSIAPLEAAYYQVASDSGGRLEVRLNASSGARPRVTLLDAQGRALIHGDGEAVGSGAVGISVSVPAGCSFVEVRNLGDRGIYEITADLVPAGDAFRPVAGPFILDSSIAVADVDGDDVADLIAPDGIHRGAGDGTFRDQAEGDALIDPGSIELATAIVGMNADGLPDLAIASAEALDDGSFAMAIRIFRNRGGGRFQAVATIPIDEEASSMRAIDLGDGGIGLAVLSSSTNQIAIYRGDGSGGFSPDPMILDGAIRPAAIAAGRFGAAGVELIVADEGDRDDGEGAGLKVFRDDGSGRFQLSTTIAAGPDPVALAAADFDRDGTLDLAVVDAMSDEVSILRNDGRGDFVARTYPVGNHPRAIVAFSSRGDGILDLAVANANSNDISVLLGNGDGTFGSQRRFGAGEFPDSLAVHDVNGDGRDDLAVAGHDSETISILVLIGRGDGSFQDDVTNPVGNYPSRTITVDLDRDGYLDIVTANYYSDDVSVLLGHGDGTFRPATYLPAGTHPRDVVSGDFNGDGRVDLAVADRGDNNGIGGGVSILIGNGDGTFQPAAMVTEYAGQKGLLPMSIAAADFTGDGDLDLAVANRGSSSVWILKGDGRGGFSLHTAGPLDHGARGPISIVAGDLTGDGNLDLAVANINSNNIAVLQGDGRGAFRPSSLIPLPKGAGDTPTALATGDFTGDGNLDLAVLSSNVDGLDYLSIFEDRGGGRFVLIDQLDLGVELVSTALVAGDLTGDGNLDLAVANTYGDAVSLAGGDGLGRFRPLSPVKRQGDRASVSVALGDFNNDGKADLAIGQGNPNSVSVLLNRGDGGFADPGAVGLSPRNTPLVADLDGDGVADLTIVDGAGDVLFRRGQAGRPGSFDPPITINVGIPSRDIAAVSTGQGVFLASVNATGPMVSLFTYRAGRFTLMRSLPAGPTPAQVVAADLMGGGVAGNLVIRNAGDGTLTIYAGDLLGSTPTRIDLAAGVGIADLAVADVDVDGLIDILLANRRSGQAEVILNRGAGAFDPPILYRAGAGLMAVKPGAKGETPSVISREGTVGIVAAPLTRGGPLDLVTVNPGSATLGVLRGLGGGRLANPVALQTAGQASVARAGDFNGDGLADLAVLGADGLTIRLGDGRGSLFPSATYDVGPDPTGLTLADVDGDGTPDLVVGDTAGDVLILRGDGTGAFRTPSPADRTVSIAVADLQGKGVPTFIVSNQSLDRLVVRRQDIAAPSSVLGDATSGLQLPGAPVLADLNDDDVHDLIVANTGGNSVLVYPGRGDGTFEPEVTRGVGFFTGTNPDAIVVADVDGDTRPDLLVANRGSNDVSVLLNKSTKGAFTFASGARLEAGGGPAALAYDDVTGDGVGDLLVSNGVSKDVRVLAGFGGGFFNDSSPKIIPLPEAPGQIFVGNFGGTGREVVALNPGTRFVTMISGLAAPAPSARLFPSGGLDPVAAVRVRGPDGFDNLVVANHDDGNVALLAGGASGLSVDEVHASPSIPNPTSLAVATIQGGDFGIYAATEGDEFATLLLFSLGGTAILSAPASGGPALTLLPSRDSSLPLIATLLITTLTIGSSGEESGPDDPQGVAAPAAASGNSAGQSLDEAAEDEETGDDEAVEDPQGDDDPTALEAEEIPPWLRDEMGLDEALEKFRLDDLPEPEAGPELMPSPEAGAGDRAEAGAPPAREMPSRPVGPGRSSARLDLIDAAVNALSREIQIREQPDVLRDGGADGPMGAPAAATPAVSITQSIALGSLLLAARRPNRQPDRLDKGPVRGLGRFPRPRR